MTSSLMANIQLNSKFRVCSSSCMFGSGRRTDFVEYTSKGLGVLPDVVQLSCVCSLLELSLLAAISSEADLVCCSGATQNFVQLVDDSPLTNHGVQRPTTFDDIAIKRLMHRDSYSVFGRIDFFSILHYLVISLGGSLCLEWTLLTPELVKVRTFNNPVVDVS